MKKEIAIATGNLHKLKEIAAILEWPEEHLLSLADFPEIPEIVEVGQTFAENALLKARTVFEHCGRATLSDDSGLEVDYLNGAPGVTSARYAGEAKDPAANNQKLLKALSGAPPERRGAQFRCVVAIVTPQQEEVVEGVVRGRIAEMFRGSAGFGYDPLFVPEGYRQTFAELGEEIKNRISHRSLAFHKARAALEKLGYR